MRTIVCKKCGATIDASLGVCPNCGAVYYILPDGDNKSPKEVDKLKWAMNSESDIDDTQVFKNLGLSQERAGGTLNARDILNADNDELFNTRVWKNTEDVNETRVFRTQPGSSGAKPPVPPVSRPVSQRTVPQNGGSAVGRENGDKNQQAERAKKQHKRNLIVGAIALLALLTLVLCIISGAFNFTGGSSGEDTMPNVVGFTQETATTVLEAMGLKVETKSESNSATKDTVVAQSIKEGKKVKSGDSVTLSISDGQGTAASAEYIEVPSLADMTYDEAKAALTKLGLQITKNDDAYDSTVESGKVVSQSPMKGAKLQKGDQVTVTISKGPEPSPSPTGFTITASAGKGGSITPSGSTTVDSGKNQTFIISAEEGYKISGVKVDGTDVDTQGSYTFTKVSSDHTISATFEKKESEATPTPAETPKASSKPASGTDIGKTG